MYKYKYKAYRIRKAEDGCWVVYTFNLARNAYIVVEHCSTFDRAMWRVNYMLSFGRK